MSPSEQSDEPGSRRAAILQAAKSALLERGVDGVSMDEVAQRAGTTKRTVYAHIHNKQALVDAVVQESTRRFLAGLPDPSSLHDDPAVAVVRYADAVQALLTWQDPIRLQRMVLGELWRTPTHGLVLLTVFEQAEQRLATYLQSLGVNDAPARAGMALAALVSRSHLRSLFGGEPLSSSLPPRDPNPAEHITGWRLAVVRALLGPGE